MNASTSSQTRVGSSGSIGISSTIVRPSATGGVKAVAISRPDAIVARRVARASSSIALAAFSATSRAIRCSASAALQACGVATNARQAAATHAPGEKTEHSADAAVAAASNMIAAARAATATAKTLATVMFRSTTTFIARA